MKTLTRLLCIVMLISIPVALLAAPRDNHGSSSYYGIGNDRSNVRLSGDIRLTDKHGRTVELSVGGRNQRIRLDNNYQCYSGGRRIDLNDIRRGDGVTIEGYRDRGNEFIGLTINVGSGYDSRYNNQYGNDNNRYESSLQARVIRSPSIFDRTLRVAALSGNNTFNIEVDSHAQVLRNGRSISVHDIRNGDVILVQGYYRGSDFVASVIQIDDGRGSLNGYDNNYDRNNGYGQGNGFRTFEGVVQSGIDYRHQRFTLDNGPDKFKVYAENARVVQNGSNIDFRDLRRDMVVTISGSVDGHTIYADHIDVSRSYRRY